MKSNGPNRPVNSLSAQQIPNNCKVTKSEILVSNVALASSKTKRRSCKLFTIAHQNTGKFSNTVQ